MYVALQQKDTTSTAAAYSKYRPIFYSIALSALLSTSACSSDTDNTARTPEIKSENPLRHKQQEAAMIEDSIINSYARLAAKRSDVCPKLVQKNVDENTIVRVAEIMVDSHCDYFLYPKIGQYLDVTVDSRDIEALLIVPTLHNFANGSYEVQAYDKHVIRLNYKGATYKPKRLRYDIAIAVMD